MLNLKTFIQAKIPLECTSDIALDKSIYLVEGIYKILILKLQTIPVL